MENSRFARTKMLLGQEAMTRIEKAKVMIVGLGAVGGYCLEALARAGVGNFVLVDFDVFEESNINRQILATDKTLGVKKVVAASERVALINPKAIVKTKDVFVNAETIDDILNENPDFVIDAIDALNPKCDLMQALWQRKIPFVSSMGAALKTDATKIKYGKLSNSKNCSLAKFVRKRLRKRGVEISDIECVWSDEQICVADDALVMEDGGQSEGRIRHTLGSMPTITAIFGLMIANEVILKLADQ